MARANNIDVIVKGDYQDKDINRAIRDLQKMQAASMSLGGRMGALGERMQKFGQSMQKVGKSMTVGLTLPIVGIGAAATKMAVDFDTSLTKMVSLVGLTRDEVDGMRGDIIRMASQYGKSAQEAADAMFFITSAGLRGSDAMETLEASLKGAAIGLGDVQTIADLATSAMNAYGPATLSATQATSILRTAVEQGKLESSELAGAMGSILPLASALGVGFDETAAAMAGMSRTGSDAAQASTQLSGILSQITKETPKGTKALASVGLSYEGLRKQLREEGLLATLQTMVQAFDGNTVATSAFFGNIRALKGVMDMLGAGADTTQQIFDALAATTENDLNPAFDAAAETTGFKLQQALATMKNSLIEFGDIIAPFVEQFAARLQQLGAAFQNLSPQTKQFIVAAAAIAAAIGPVLLIVGKLITVVGGAVKMLGAITLAGSVLAIKVVAVVAAVAAVALAFKAMYDRSESLRDAVRTLISTVQNIARTLAGDLFGAFKSVIGAGGDARSIFDRIATVAGNVLSVALRALAGWWNVLANGVRVTIKVFEVIGRVFVMTGNLIRGAVMAAIDILFNRLGPVSAAFRNLANGVKSAFSNIASIVTGAFSNAGKAVAAGINLGINAVNKMIDAYNKLADVLPGVTRATHIAEFTFKDLSAGAERASYSANNLANDIGGYASQVLRGNQATEAGITAFNGLNVAAGDAALGIDDVGKSAGKAGGASEQAAAKLEKFKAKFNEVAERLKTARQEIEQQYTGMAQTVQNAVIGSIDFGEALPEIDEEGNRVGGTFMDRLNEQATRAKEFADKVRLLIQQGLSPEAITMVVQEGINAGTSIANELINAGGTAIDDTNRLVEATTLAGQEVGLLAAETYYGTGLALAKKTEDGFHKRFGEGGPGWNKLNRMMSHLARSMDRTSTITVVTRHVTEGVPGRRMGGPVAAGSPYIVGEAGPELFVPTVSGQIIPNHDMNAVSSGRGAASVGGGRSVINIHVNAGIGTDGAEVGRQIVNSIKQYERRNGAVYVSA